MSAPFRFWKHRFAHHFIPLLPDTSMLTSQRPKAVLMLNDGTRFEGRAFGALGTIVGEICFTTGMTGYQEVVTDPSSTGQIMVMAAPHVGNYGVKQAEQPLDSESESTQVSISGLVVKRYSEVWSRAGSTGSLDAILKEAGIPGISDIDTRKLVRHIRDHGVQNAIIDTTGLDDGALRARLAEAPAMAGRELASKVTGKELREYGDPEAPYRVALLDFGIKLSTVRHLLRRGCLVGVFPMYTDVDTMLAWRPDGFLLGNGPGDPAAMPDAVEWVKATVGTNLPVFGICMGHQLLSRSLGLATVKMHHGHRGLNHPVRNMITGKDEITSQNHGFQVDRKEVEAHPELEITHEHLNDGSVVGIRLKGRPVFSVQYHPEGGPGPLDPEYLFDEFVGHMQEHKELAGKMVRHA